MAYAEKTKVPVSQSKAQIEALVKKKGAQAFGVLERKGVAQVVFELEGRNIMFRMKLPETPQEERSIWRALLLTIKGKIESAERGIESFEDAFLAQVVMPSGRTVGEEVAPRIAQTYNGGQDVPLLPRS